MHASRLRILHILRAPIGGLFRHVADLVEEQARAGHEVGIVCDIHAYGEHSEDRLAALKAHCRLGLRRIAMSRTPGAGDVAALREVKAHVTALAPDVVHGHGAKGGAYARLLPRHGNRIAVYTPHGGSLHYAWWQPGGALYLGLERGLKRNSDGLLFESRFAARAYVRKMGAPHCPARIVPNGLKPCDFEPLHAAEPLHDAAFVGELRRLKGVGTLIEAARSIARRRPFRLAIAGTGPDEALFKTRIAEEGLSKHVEFLGHRPARAVFEQARMLVVPSFAESFPYVVLEAMAAGHPVIATRVGGIPEMFGNEAEALVPPKDGQALANAIEAALDRPQAGRDRAARLRARAQMHFNVERMGRDITAFYLAIKTREGASAPSLEVQLKMEESGPPARRELPDATLR